MTASGEGVVLVAATQGGVERGARLVASLPRAELLVVERACSRASGLDARCVAVGRGGLGPAVAERFHPRTAQMIFFLSVGATVRLIAPHLADKRRDPGVIAVDEAGQFVVPVVGGHLGGANAWARHVAAELGALPAITTASDQAGLPAVDLLGQEQGWAVEASPGALRGAAAALVNDQPVALVEEAEPWQAPRAPPNLFRFSTIAEVDVDAYAAVLWVSREPVPPQWQAYLGQRLVRYRPAEDDSV